MRRPPGHAGAAKNTPEGSLSESGSSARESRPGSAAGLPTARSRRSTARSTTSWTTGGSVVLGSCRVSDWSFRRAPHDMTGPHQLDDAPDRRVRSDPTGQGARRPPGPRLRRPRPPHRAQTLGQPPGPRQGPGGDEAAKQVEAELLAQIAAGQHRGSKTTVTGGFARDPAPLRYVGVPPASPLVGVRTLDDRMPQETGLPRPAGRWIVGGTIYAALPSFLVSTQGMHTLNKPDGPRAAPATLAFIRRPPRR
jgi:hypothetical protein